MKTYQFKMHSLVAEFWEGGVSLVVELNKKTDFETIEVTWPEAQECFKEFAAKTPAPAACFLMCTSTRKPNGFKNAETTIYRRP